jgi:hypothetical protein
MAMPIEPLPQVGNCVEIYSMSAKTWATADVKAVTDVNMALQIYDIVVEYTVATEEMDENEDVDLLGNANTQVKRMKKVAVFDQKLCRSARTGNPFEAAGDSLGWIRGPIYRVISDRHPSEGRAENK